MTIYPGEIPAADPRARLEVGTVEVGVYKLGVVPGKLIIRGTTEQLTTEGIRNTEPETVTQITACAAGAEIQYYINESQLTVQAENVALLVDHIVDDAYNQTLEMLAEPALSGLENQAALRCQFRYLDLVDTSRGNTWVTASGPMEIIWPYPEDTTQEDSFTIIHYKGMDQDYDLSQMASLQLGRDYTLEVYTTGALGAGGGGVTYYPLTPGESGLSFTADGFSAYVLIWEGEAAVEEDGGLTVPPDDPEPSEGPEGLNTADHYAYLMGRGGGGIQPLANIARAEVATIFFRLLTDEARAACWNDGNWFPDVEEGRWYHNAVGTMARMGIFQGDDSGTFRPGDPITRAEFVAIAVRFFQFESSGGVSFPDVRPDSWYAGAVCTGAELGLILGREDGSFGPREPITRAEAAAIVNRMLDRGPLDQVPPEEAGWTDNPPGAWYYGDMVEASVSHTYRRQGGGEIWNGSLEERDWTALERFGPEK